MDYHLKFRFDSINKRSSILGAAKATRLPASNAPLLFRPKCKPVPLSEQEPFPAGRETVSPEPSTNQVPVGPDGKDNPQIQQQVKQLQFWLKVFSRFCQEDRPNE